MGIPRLTSLVDNTFTGWQREEIRGNLIIDGYSMCYKLYSFDWGHGGQYPEYREKVTRFFLLLRKSGITPTVLMDGIDYKEEKTETILRRRTNTVKTIHRHTANNEKRNLETLEDGVLPSLVIGVFITVMMDLNINLIVADGEGDEWIYKLANAYSCPVLSSDSDFLMYKLKRGYIPLNRFHWEASPINAEVYYYSAFCDQSRFRDESLRLIIPAIMGNDFIPAVDSTKLMSHIARKSGFETRGIHRLVSVIRYLQYFNTLEDFIDQIGSISCLDGEEKKQLRSNCLEARRMYDLDETTTLEEMREKTELRAFNSEPIPDWLWKQFRTGKLSPSIIGSLVIGRNLLNTYIESTAIDSCSQASLPIRQFFYGLLGSGLITEYYRQGLEISGKGIRSIETLKGRPLPSLTRIPTLSILEREDLLYSILGCDDGAVQRLHDYWKLVMAATVFWSRHTSASPQIVKALILSFVVCSTCVNELSKMRSEFFIPVSFRRSPKWMPILHSFSQWQSVYTDTLALNQVLMHPLKASSPAYLYDGKLAMFFAHRESVDHLVSMLPIDQQLFETLVCTVLPQRSSPPKYQAPRQQPVYSQPPRFQNSSRGQQEGHSRGQNFSRGQQQEGHSSRGQNFSRGQQQEGHFRDQQGHFRDQQGHSRGQRGHGRSDGVWQQQRQGSTSDNWREGRSHTNEVGHQRGTHNDAAAARWSQGKPNDSRGQGYDGGRGQGQRNVSRQGEQATKDQKPNPRSRGAGVPPPPQARTLAPKFAHANRYSTLLGDEGDESSSSDES